MMKETRKVDYVNGRIQLLKRDGNGGWNNKGKIVKSLKSLDLMINNNLFDFNLTEEVAENLEIYREKEKIRREIYFGEKQYN
jgi:hypothetical protein